jgi:DNA-binding Lrp family transcriptional regulator
MNKKTENFPQNTIDSIDYSILQMLQTDAKIGVKEISSSLNLSKTPVYERIKRMESNGVIRKYVALIDKVKLGNSMVVFCTVSLDVQKLEQINQFNAAIKEMPEVVECYLMGGVFDYMLKVIVRDLEAYHTFSSEKLAALPNINQIKSLFVLNEVKYSTAIPNIWQ